VRIQVVKRTLVLATFSAIRYNKQLSEYYEKKGRIQVVKRTLVWAALSAIRYNKQLSEYYEKRREGKKNGGRGGVHA
jgi:ribosomal protein L10